jgi:riboflavin biosynthesis pyrimidine reductase
VVAETQKLLRMFPGPADHVALHGLYLNERFAPPATRSDSFVYTNFIASLDGRISLPDPRSLKRTVPRAIANGRDWRLFQELAASADALVTSGRYVRDVSNTLSTRSFPVSNEPDYADLVGWRLARGLKPQPAVVVVSERLDLPLLRPLVDSGRSLYVATGSTADPSRVATIEEQGVRVLRVGNGARVEGGKLVRVLAEESHRNIALIGGGEILNALLLDDALDRLYLTLACRILGGLSFDTLLTGPVLERAAGFTLNALHYDAGGAAETNVEQLFAVFDRDRTH